MTAAPTKEAMLPVTLSLRYAAKDIPDREALVAVQSGLIVDGHKCPACWWKMEGLNAPRKVILAKMRALLRRGLIDGCACGCRGDFELTLKGDAFLTEPPS